LKEWAAFENFMSTLLSVFPVRGFKQQTIDPQESVISKKEGVREKSHRFGGVPL